VEQLIQAIEKTIDYGRKFKTEYGFKEIETRLISENVYTDGEIRTTLIKMGRGDFKNKNRFIKKKMEKTESLVKRLAKVFSDILLVGITGSVAAEYPKENEDIDLMIITKKESLWITRFLLKMWMEINLVPQRKRGKKQDKDEFCINLWLEEGSLELPAERHNLNNAMDLILMKPVINKNNIYEKFIRENDWAEKYVATGYNKIISNFKFSISNKKEKTNIFKKAVNGVAFGLQYFYMRKKIKNETVDLKRAFFHPKSR
jgi:hypothetical protein